MSWLKQVLGRIVRERSSPSELGWAVALGIVIGCSPFIGLHLGICLVVATVFGLNRAVTYLAANISVPWMQPVLIFSSLQLGTFALEGHWMGLSLDQLTEEAVLELGATWLVGSAILGLLIGAPLGALTFLVARAYRRRHPHPPDPTGDAIDRVVARYRPAGPFPWRYVRAKLTDDPVYRQVAEKTPVASPVLDLGCGRGQTVVLLEELQPKITLQAIDSDAAKLEVLKSIAPSVDARAGDVFADALPEASTVLLIDVLHYESLERQDALLDRLAQNLPAGGRLLIREVDNARGLRSALTRLQERLARWGRLNRGSTLCFRPASTIQARLESHGLEVSVTPSWGQTPFANVLLEAHR